MTDTAPPGYLPWHWPCRIAATAALLGPLLRPLPAHT